MPNCSTIQVAAIFAAPVILLLAYSFHLANKDNN